MLKFLRFLNPFANARRIRELELDLSIADANCDYFRASRDRHANTSATLRSDIVAHEQACEAFMAERDALKAEIDVHGRLGLILTATVLRADRALGAADRHVRDLEEKLAVQASETLEVVQYVKQVEQRLAASGITITDGENGPLVVVNQEAFITAVRGATHTSGPDVTLH